MRIHDLFHLSEASRPTDMLDITTRLARGGWHPIDEGSYATIFAKEGVDYVLKTFEVDDAGYAEFVKLTKQFPNPHWPRFRGQPMEINDAFSAIRMEKLEHRDGTLSHLSPYFAMKRGDEVSLDTYGELRALLTQYPDLKIALDLIEEHLLGRFMLDLRADNTMQRSDGTPVITDPVSQQVLRFLLTSCAS